MLHFAEAPQSTAGRDLVNENFARDDVTWRCSFASRAPDWLRKIGLRPMPLGTRPARRPATCSTRSMSTVRSLQLLAESMNRTRVAP
jgi:hypothetical protein